MEESNIDRGQPRTDRDKLESPLEELFIENLEKYVSPFSLIHPQYQVQTIVGKFRLDFVVELKGIKIGFECDGKEFHDEYRDEWRDGFILHNGDIDTIYRFRGKDLFTFINDCIYIIYKYDPFLFNDRFAHLYSRLISTEVANYFEICDDSYRNYENIMVHYPVNNFSGQKIGEIELMATRRNKNKFGHWQELIKYGLDNPGLPLDQLIEIRKSEVGNRLF